MSNFTPGPWLRDGNLIYTLTQDGWRKGEPVTVNRLMVSVQPGKGMEPGEFDANCDLIAAAESHALLLAALVSGRARYGTDGNAEHVVWVDDRRFRTALDAFGCPTVSDDLRKALEQRE